MLAELDKLHARHLPATLRSALDHAGKFPQAAFALRALGELHARLTRGEFPDNAAAALLGGRVPAQILQVHADGVTVLAPAEKPLELPGYSLTLVTTVGTR